MIVIQWLLGLAAGWALIGHVLASHEARTSLSGANAREVMSYTLVSFILALGFLGLTLK